MCTTSMTIQPGCTADRRGRCHHKAASVQKPAEQACACAGDYLDARKLTTWYRNTQL